jgi:hypothetical protein
MQRLKSDKVAATPWASAGRHFALQMRAPALMLFVAGLTGCAVYHAAPLPAAPGLVRDPAALARRLPDGRLIETASPLSLQEIAALAVLNDPDLRAARAQHDIAAAELMAAGELPDPSLSGGFAALLGGPGTMPAISGALSQDIGALITYKANRQAAAAGLKQVDAGIIWQEWQTAAQAEQLAVALCADRDTLQSLQADAALLSGIDQATQAEIGQNNLTLNDGGASMAALPWCNRRWHRRRRPRRGTRPRWTRCWACNPVLPSRLQRRRCNRRRRIFWRPLWQPCRRAAPISLRCATAMNRRTPNCGPRSSRSSCR